MFSILLGIYQKLRGHKLRRAARVLIANKDREMQVNREVEKISKSDRDKIAHKDGGDEQMVKQVRGATN
jgi:hypothetical protein